MAGKNVRYLLKGSNAQIKVFSIFISIVLVFGISIPTCLSASSFADTPANHDANLAESNSITDSLVDIFTTNDVHAEISQCDNDEAGLNYGLSYANVAQIKKDHPNSLLVDAGDHSNGGIYAKFDSGHTMVKLMKLCGYDLAVPGNHEFDFGVDSFYNINAYANDPSEGTPFKYLSCNFYRVDPTTQQRNENILDSYTIKEVNGKKIAFVGVMTPETIYKTAPAYFQDQEGNFLYGISSGDDMYADFNNAVDQAKAENPDFIVGIGHLGVDESSTVNMSKSLILNSHDVDAYIDGHSHTVIPRPADPSANPPDSGDNGVWPDSNGHMVKAVQTGTAFANIGHLAFNESTTQNSTYSIENSVIPKTDFGFNPDSRDSSVLAVEKAWKHEVDSTYDSNIAKSGPTFYFGEGNATDASKRYARRRETNLTDLIADAFYWKGNSAELGGCDASIINGGGIRSFIDPSETVSRRTCAAVLPYANAFAIAIMPGSLVREFLEFAYKDYGNIDSDGLYIENAGIMHCSGMLFSVDTNKTSTIQTGGDGKVWEGPPIDGQYRVSNIKIYNKQTASYDDIDLNKNYKIAGSSYFFKNFGDGFMMFRNKNVSQVATDYIIDVVLGDYISSFNKGSDGLAYLSSLTSPLACLPNFQINYETMFGANRVGAYTVTFDSDGGSQIPPQNVFIDSKAYKPVVDPSKTDMVFRGWYADTLRQSEFDFENPITQNTTIYAKWANAYSDTSFATKTSDFWIIFGLSLLGFSIFMFILYYAKKRHNANKNLF